MIRARRIRPNRHGGFDLRLPPAERQLLRSLTGQLEPILALGSDDLRRLYPPAYSDDPTRQAEYDQLMRADLIEHHRHALSVLAATAGSKQITEDELAVWLKAINSLRLVLGTRLGVTEDTVLTGPGDPRTPSLSVYHYLSFLQEQGTEALSASLS